jgi:hypothetical protein
MGWWQYKYKYSETVITVRQESTCDEVHINAMQKMSSFKKW